MKSAKLLSKFMMMLFPHLIAASSNGKVGTVVVSIEEFCFHDK